MKTKNAKKPTDQLKAIALADIVIGKTNPRKFFDEDALKELSESIANQGLLQPILVRPFGKDKYQLVCGERRFRASKMAKVKTINAVIRELDDKVVLEMQITENLQRKDVHPLDEARAIEMLFEKGDSKEDIAKRLGVSLKYITHRIQLNELIPEFAEIYYKDKMKISVALIIATLAANSQFEFFEENYKDWKELENFKIDSLGWGFNQLKGKLNNAPFKLDNPSLNNKCACNDCPFNSLNKGLLFPDKNKEAICLDIVCFKAKTEHARKNTLEAVKVNKTPIVVNGYVNNLTDVKEELKSNDLAISNGEVVEKPTILNFEAYCEDNFWLDEKDEDYEEDLKQAKSDYKEWKKETEKEIKAFEIAFEKGEIIEGVSVDSNGNLIPSLVILDKVEIAPGVEVVEEKDVDLNKATSLELRRREIDYEKMQTALHSTLKKEYTSLNSKLELDEKIAYVIALLSKLPWDSENILLLSCEVSGYDKSTQIYEAYKKDSSGIDKDIALLARMLIVDSNYHETSSIRKSKTALSLFEAFKTQLPKKVAAIVEEMKTVQNVRQGKFETKLKKLVSDTVAFISKFNKENPL